MNSRPPDACTRVSLTSQQGACADTSELRCRKRGVDGLTRSSRVPWARRQHTQQTALRALSSRVSIGDFHRSSQAVRGVRTVSVPRTDEHLWNIDPRANTAGSATRDARPGCQGPHDPSCPLCRVDRFTGAVEGSCSEAGSLQAPGAERVTGATFGRAPEDGPSLCPFLVASTPTEQAWRPSLSRQMTARQSTLSSGTDRALPQQ